MTEARSAEQKRVDGLVAELKLLELKHDALEKEIESIENRIWIINHPINGDLTAALQALKLKEWCDQVNGRKPAIWTNPTHEPKGGVWKVTPKQVHIAIAAIPDRIDRIPKDSGRLDLKAMGISPY
jgi:hypothetical protein